MTQQSQDGERAAWTAEEIEARLGASTVAFRHPPYPRPIGAREIAAIREAGLTRIEVTGIRSPHGFDFTDRGQLSEVKAACRNEGVSVVSVHGPSRGYASEDEDERRQAVGDAVNAARVSEELGAGVMVCHFGTDERSEQSVTDVLEQTDDSTLRLAVENGKDLRDFADIVDRVGSDRFGMIVDIGHTRDADGVNPFTKPEAARRTMAQCGDRLIHLHLHDFRETDHLAPMDGDIEWGEIFEAFRDIDYAGMFMFESAWRDTARTLDPEYVLARTAAFPRSFAERYGAAS